MWLCFSSRLTLMETSNKHITMIKKKSLIISTVSIVSNIYVETFHKENFMYKEMFIRK